MSTGFTVRGIDRLRRDIERLGHRKKAFYKACLKELAARILSAVIRRTPVGEPPRNISPDIHREYWDGYIGGALRRGWTAETHEEAVAGSGEPTASDILDFANNIEVVEQGQSFWVTIKNPVFYASFVEYGHRQQAGRYVPQLGKRLKASWVNGQFMLKISADELKANAPAIIERKLRQWLRQIGG